jgi:GNAT superfamily N-acetyltransferase
MSEVRRVSLSTLIDDTRFQTLVDEYTSESSIKDMPPINWQRHMYEQLEAIGIFRVLAAYEGDKLIGFMTLLTTVLPHYGALTATTESVFVEAEHRSGGAGLKLIRAAEGWAKELGAVGLLLSAPYGGRLADIGPRIGYQQTNVVFFKRLQ